MIYCIASRINNKDYLLVNRTLPLGPLCCRTEKDIKTYFKVYYEVMTKEAIDSSNYKICFQQLLITHPVIIALDNDQGESILDEWIEDVTLLKTPLEIIQFPHSLIAMKNGFIDKFQILDIVRDIESIPRIGLDGEIQIFHFSISAPGEQNSIKTMDDANELEKKRGFQ